MASLLTDLERNHQRRNQFCGFSWVLENKIGGMRMPQTLQELLSVVDKFGIGLVVSLTENPLPFTSSIPKEFYARTKILHLPVDDFSTPTIDQVKQFLDAAHNTIRSGNGVAVHCHAGLGRTGTMIAAFLVSHYCELGRVEPQKAMALVRDKRRGSICTRGQENFIITLYNNEL